MSRWLPTAARRFLSHLIPHYRFLTIVKNSGFCEIGPMPACFSEQGGSHRRGGTLVPQITEKLPMTYETKTLQRERFLAEFLRRIREAPPGTRVYMRVGDVFRDADVVSIDVLRAARRAAVVRDDDNGEEEDTSC